MPLGYTPKEIEQFPELALSHAPMCACGNCPWIRWGTEHATSTYGIPVLLCGPTGDNAPARAYTSVADAIAAGEPTFIDLTEAK